MGLCQDVNPLCYHQMLWNLTAEGKAPQAKADLAICLFVLPRCRLCNRFKRICCRMFWTYVPFNPVREEVYSLSKTL